MPTENKTVYAALDIGTSQLKLGVYCPQLSASIKMINHFRNELVYESSGAVMGDYHAVYEKTIALLKELGAYINSNRIKRLYLGICGHISSLIEWDKETDYLPSNLFPTWLDTSCYDSLDEYREIMGNGKSRAMIGTFLPAGTNWLLTKLLHQKRKGFNEGSIFLQVGDAVFHQLTGAYQTHFSSQLSMVNLQDKKYAPALLDHLDLPELSLPHISYGCLPLLEAIKSACHFPDESFVFPAMADLYASLYGLKLEDKEGFMLANTSEQAGAFYLKQPEPQDRFQSISFDPGFINYGSTNTGGNVVQWFVTTVLNKEMSPEVLNELTQKASSVVPNDTPLILPYLQGERAPLWNPRLTASILELKSSHSEVHLFRAILESIAFARRQCFEQLGLEDLDLIKIAGGSSKNELWNLIRATVLNKPLALAHEKELAIAGLINNMLELNERDSPKPAIEFSVLRPRPELTADYDEKYQRFIHYQQLLS